MTDSQLTLKLIGSSISVDILQEAVSAFTALLHDATNRLCSPGNDVKWIVDVLPGSVVVNVIPHSVSVPFPMMFEVVDHLEHGFTAVSQGNVPDFFSDNALRLVSRLAALSGPPEKPSGTSIQILRGEKVAELSVTHSSIIDSYLDRQMLYKDWGSVEGIVTSLSLAKGYHFTITDILLRGSVSCSFDSKLLSVLLKAFGQRVMVSGLIHYNTTGDIRRVEVEEVDVFRPDSELPTAYDVRGILAGGA